MVGALKSNFLKSFVLKIIDCLDTNEDTSAEHSKITTLDAILMISDASNKLMEMIILYESDLFKII